MGILEIANASRASITPRPRMSAQSGRQERSRRCAPSGESVAGCLIPHCRSRFIRRRTRRYCQPPLNTRSRLHTSSSASSDIGKTMTMCVRNTRSRRPARREKKQRRECAIWLESMAICRCATVCSRSGCGRSGVYGNIEHPAVQQSYRGAATRRNSCNRRSGADRRHVARGSDWNQAQMIFRLQLRQAVLL
jgi:hypothetical protein